MGRRAFAVTLSAFSQRVFSLPIASAPSVCVGFLDVGEREKVGIEWGGGRKGNCKVAAAAGRGGGGGGESLLCTVQ